MYRILTKAAARENINTAKKHLNGDREVRQANCSRYRLEPRLRKRRFSEWISKSRPCL